MPIEIRELVIKATVHERLNSPLDEKKKRLEEDKLKQEILDLCREEIREALEEQQKR